MTVVNYSEHMWLLCYNYYNLHCVFSWYLDLRLKFFGCRETADFLFYVTLQRKKDCIIPTL